MIICLFLLFPFCFFFKRLTSPFGELTARVNDLKSFTYRHSRYNRPQQRFPGTYKFQATNLLRKEVKYISLYVIPLPSWANDHVVIIHLRVGLTLSVCTIQVQFIKVPVSACSVYIQQSSVHVQCMYNKEFSGAHDIPPLEIQTKRISRHMLHFNSYYLQDKTSNQ